jgi:electron transfer flavoprotein beta subunit
MKVFVCIKQVPDTAGRIPLADETHIDESGIGDWVINPFDEYALEEALRLKEARGEVEVVLVCLGPERSVGAIRTALAMGADRELFIVTEEFLDHHLIARAIATAIENDGPGELIFMGKQAVDDDGYQVHLRVAHMLDLPAVTNVIAFEMGDGVVRVSREIEEGARQNIEMKLPAVVAVTKGINEPRFPNLGRLIKARKKEITRVTLADLGIEKIVNHEEIVGLSQPPEKPPGRILQGEKEQSVSELLGLLHKEAGVL